MSAVADDHGVKSLSNAALITLLKRLDAEERHISKLGSVLHTKIERLRASSDDTPESVAELESSLSKERETSRRRLQLNEQINELRIERSRRLYSLRAPLLTVVK
jgi:hypothetical protein